MSVHPAIFSPRHYAILAAGFALFIIFGSLVPFETRSRDWADVWASFVWAMSQRIAVESRADAISNIALGIPFGFCLLAALRVDREGRWRTLLTGFSLVVPCGLLLATLVEFAQLYLPKRTCSGADVVAQGIGASIGVLGWVIGGAWWTSRIRWAWNDSRITGGLYGHVLIGYLVLVVIVQSFPFDFSISPSELHHKLMRSSRLIPMMEFSTWLAQKRRLWMVRLPEWAEISLLYLPIGVLAAKLPGRAWRTILFPILAASLVAGFIEFLQFFVMTRRTSATDIVIGAAAIVVGWRACRWASGNSHSGGIRWLPFVVFAVGLLTLLIVSEWTWFLLREPIFHSYFAKVDWLEMEEFRKNHPIMGPAGLVTHAFGYLLVGALIAARGATLTGWHRPAVAVGIALGIAAVLEAGRMRFAALEPRFVPLILAAFAAAIGANVCQRLRAESGATS